MSPTGLLALLGVGRLRRRWNSGVQEADQAVDPPGVVDAAFQMIAE
jgi:hypothetical protein